VVIPDIAHHEVRRELLRIRAVGSLRRLDYALDPSSGLDHLVVTTDAIIKAAEFWAFLRKVGVPTASPDAPDADAVLAGQAALAGRSRSRAEGDKGTDGIEPRSDLPDASGRSDRSALR
jgi:hypothetical protein